MKDTENRPQPRKRRKWGSVIVRRDADGNPASFQARYVNPLDPPKKVGRNFGLEYETEAYKWLDVEHYLVALHNKGIRQDAKLREIKLRLARERREIERVLS